MKQRAEGPIYLVEPSKIPYFEKRRDSSTAYGFWLGVGGATALLVVVGGVCAME